MSALNKKPTNNQKINELKKRVTKLEKDNKELNDYISDIEFKQEHLFTSKDLMITGLVCLISFFIAQLLFAFIGS